MPHAVVREHLQTFLEEACERSDQELGLPHVVAEEFERYLACGVLANGFARVRCRDCGHDLLVAFSCKRRGVCPSCNTRRMRDTAAHLVDAVIPRVPVRQWVLSLPRGGAGSSPAMCSSRAGRWRWPCERSSRTTAGARGPWESRPGAAGR